jgi:hypothetical protein
MTVTVDWANKIVSSDASITDIVVFHQSLRALETSVLGMLYLPIHQWRSLDLGGGASFNQIDFINGYQLKFPTAGNYTITGNLNATIVPATGVYVERKTSLAYTTTAVGATAPTPADIASAVWTQALEQGLTAEQILRVILAPLAGKASGIGTTTELYFGQDGVTPRVTANFDSSGNRVSMTVNGA